MSWSFEVTGTPERVAEYLAYRAVANPCSEPEQSIRAGVVNELVRAVQAFPRTAMVKISASGSQYSDPSGITNSLKVNLEPVYNFIG